ncbi:rCG57271 [Rattus norvegicus]|uniref:RCG57271 n=1 Tax=Rattus norvegicus TaxID=10116 RepID=A6JP46_RAT|nr:rCG57271 [Rattus norvegicus]
MHLSLKSHLLLKFVLCMYKCTSICLCVCMCTGEPICAVVFGGER